MSAVRTVVEFTERPYLRSHGTAPRGRGVWAFSASSTVAAFDADLFGPVCTWSGTLTSARREARAHFGALGVRYVAVLP